ncbi:MAG: TolC family outer membrane protein [Rhodospirillales bacterium]|nr:TolC family outer membrane protein [Alphaproteobacteria bacterium]MCB9987419.1 TolC family outer membrane protein [Rhodospirillales bacterium]USO07599.1 MAG: TolC family outer membrane protein [Rhodospirillales bacterium]
MTDTRTRLKLTIAAASLLAAFPASAPARADMTADILSTPATVTEPGRRSAPLVSETPVPAVTVAETMIASAPKSAPVVEQQPKSAPAPAISEAAPPPVAQDHASSASMNDILAAAYTDSPALRAERETLRQQYENVALAQSNRRPVVTAGGGIAWEGLDSNPGGRATLYPRNIGVTATQYLYRGGATLAEVERQLRLSDAAIAAYDTAVQNTLLTVVTAAMDIQNARATIDLTDANRAVIDRQLASVTRGFDVGELTRTDVAQAQARLSGADAALLAAHANFSSALARFRQYAGADGADLVLKIDPHALPVPASLDAALAQADAAHPTILAAKAAEQAAEAAIRAAQAGLLPSVSAQAGVGKAWDQTTVVNDVANATLGLNASVPLYDGGASRARIRQAKHAKREAGDRVADAKRAVDEQVTSAWNNYNAALAQIGARAKQADAAQIARDGVHREMEVGTRTVLDELNADQELLDAQVGKVQANRDAVVAAYALMAATGQLTGESLGLFSADAERAKVHATQEKWLGTDIEGAD